MYLLCFFIDCQKSIIIVYNISYYIDIFENIFIYIFNCLFKKNFYNCYFFLNWFDVRDSLKGSLVMDFVKSNEEIRKKNLDFELNQKKIPLFYCDFFFSISEGLNIWGYNKTFYSELDNKFFFENFYNSKHLKFRSNYLSSNSENYLTFFDLYFKNPKNKYCFSAYNSLENLSKDNFNDKFIIRFPKRNFRLNKLEYVLKNFNVKLDFFYKNTSGKVPFGQSKNVIYNNFKIVNIQNENLFMDDKKDSGLILSYFDYLNNQTTKFINDKYGIKNVRYNVSNIQAEHLIKLSFLEIQYILKLIHEDPYFKDRSFLDVHWELYNGFCSISKKFDFIFYDNIFFLEKYIYNKLPFYLKFFFMKIFGFIKEPLLLNPFELNFSKNYSFYALDFLKVNKKYYFKEEELMRLPIHILLKNNYNVSNENFFSVDINQRSRSSVFFNLFYNYNETFRNKFFKYFNFSKLSMRGLNFLFDSNYVNNKGSFQKFYYLVDNPWWDCLNFETRSKILKILSMRRERSHLLMINLIDRSFINKKFYNNSELNFFSKELDLELLNSLKRLNLFFYNDIGKYYVYFVNFFSIKFSFDLILSLIYDMFFNFFFLIDLTLMENDNLIQYNNFVSLIDLNLKKKYIILDNIKVLNLDLFKDLYYNMFLLKFNIYQYLLKSKYIIFTFDKNILDVLLKLFKNLEINLVESEIDFGKDFLFFRDKIDYKLYEDVEKVNNNLLNQIEDTFTTSNGGDLFFFSNKFLNLFNEFFFFFNEGSYIDFIIFFFLP